jgi:beta-lactamase superfamily II metal-dependent hydrolase
MLTRILNRSAASLVFVLFGLWAPVWAQANGSLQIHFMDVGQGDGALLISPGGETVLFDDGNVKDCSKPVSYLQNLKVTKIDYHIASHYHSDHIGCAPDIFAKFPLQKEAIDRGGSYNSTVYQKYVVAVGTKRHTAAAGEVVTLDAASSHPVTIKVVALNGNGVSTTNENDLSVVTLVQYGSFHAEISGDLSGYHTASYEDIETSVAPLIGQVEVYKVHHHCSQYSTNATWVSTVQPKIGIVSVGDGNDYGHPTRECLEQLHNAGVKLYWTENGNGEAPDSTADIVAGTTIVQFELGASTFSVTHGGQTDTYSVWDQNASTPPVPTTVPKYAWSKNSGVYHYAKCKYVASIKPENLVRGDTPPADKTLHQQCPQ